jgi:hypothetical protein
MHVRRDLAHLRRLRKWPRVESNHRTQIRSS